MILSRIKITTLVSALYASSIATSSAVEYITATPATDGWWSNVSYWRTLVSWSPYTTDPATEIPNVNDNSVSLNTKSLVIDGNYTTKGVYTNSGLSTGIVEMRAQGEAYDPTKQSLLIDVAKGYSHTTIGGYAAIQMRGSSSTVNQTLTFTNGVYNFTNTANLGNVTIALETYSNTNASGTSVKTLNFDADTTINSTENLRTYGLSGTSVSRSVFNFSGTVNLKNGSTWKDYSSANSTVNISGAFNTGKVTVESGVVNVVSGGVLSATNTISVRNGATLNVAGAVVASPLVNNLDNIAIGTGGKLVVETTGSLSISSGYSIIRLSGTLEINSAENSVIITRYLRMHNGANLILNSTNALRDWATQAPSLWTSDNGSMTVEINADNTLHGICFRSSNPTDSAVVTMILGEGCDLLTMDNISVKCDDIEGYLLGENRLIIVNFENGRIKVLNDMRDEDELLNIYAEGYEDGSFRLVADDLNGGYWLTGTAVPEPATIAFVAGLSALAFAVLRRSKR